MSTVTDWISRYHIADICCGSDIMVMVWPCGPDRLQDFNIMVMVWTCGPDRLQDFLKPHVTDSDNDSLSECPFYQNGTINDLQD